MKFPSSMRNWRFNTSECRGKLQKMEALYIHSPKIIIFLSPLLGLPSSIVASRVTPQWHRPHRVISYNCIGHSRLLVVSIVASIVIPKFLHCTILVTLSVKSSFQQNFNLKWARIQCGMDLGCSWMFFFTVDKDLLSSPWRMLWVPGSS
jgi:hypothetical protein